MVASATVAAAPATDALPSWNAGKTKQSIVDFVTKVTQPIAAFGNSDGDQQMLESTTAGSGARFALIVHHDDAAREWAYEREPPIGRLDAGWNEATAKGWTVVSMKDDWKAVYPPEKK
ncbi:MAG: hypothetical protein ACREPX_01915 [Rhodanobacteraceae bacterium]